MKDAKEKARAGNIEDSFTGAFILAQSGFK
jgi:hypothetical protein